MVKCPECRARVGEGTGVDIYKHALGCLHLSNEGVDRLLASHAGKDDERSQRIVKILTAAKEGG